MKKTSYKGPKGASFRIYFHGNGKANGCTFQRVAKKADRGRTEKREALR